MKTTARAVTTDYCKADFYAVLHVIRLQKIGFEADCCQAELK